MRLTSRQRFLLFALSCGAILLLLLLAYVSTVERNVARDAVVQTESVLEASREVVGSLVDAETGQRGYLITGDERYLEPYEAGTRKGETALARLTSLVAGSPAQAARVDTLRGVTERKRSELARTIEVRRAEGESAAQAIVRHNGGRQLMDSVRALAGRIETAERDLLSRRDERERALRRGTIAILLGGGMIALMLVVISSAALVGSAATEARLTDELTRQTRVLAESESRISAIVVSAMDAIVGKTLEGTVTSWNAAAERIFGYTAAEMIGQPIYRLIPPALHAAERDMIARIARGERVELSETERITKDGRWIVVGLSISPILDASGAVIGASSIKRDITERKRAEAELEQSNVQLHDQAAELKMQATELQATTDELTEQQWRTERALEELRGSEVRYRSLAMATASLVWAIRADGRLEYIHGSWSELSGQSVEDAQGGGWLQVVHADDRARATSEWDRALAMGTPLELEFRVQARGGGIRHLRLVGVPVVQQMGGREWVGTIRDLTAQREAEASARLIEGERRLAFEAAGLGTWVWDPAADVLAGDATYRQALGLSGDADVSSSALAAAVHPDDREEVEAARRQMLSSGTDHEMEFRVVWPDSSIHWLAARGRAFFESDGRPVAVRGIVMSIDLRRQLEARLEQAQRMDAVGKLAGGVAHEANNQMTVVLGSAAFALRRPDLPAEARAELEQIRRAAERTAGITRQLLAFGRRQFLKPTSLDLNRLLEDFVPFLRRTLDERSDVVLHLSPRLGPVLADRGQLEQVLVNLALNARDAMPEGGLMTIETDAIAAAECDRAAAPDATRGRYAALVVSDTGSGMDDATLKHIFEPFFTTKPVGQGTGLGLSTVYGIVKQLGGDIQVRSAPGQGTRFRLHLPLADAVSPAVGPATAVPLTSAAGTVLVVEDEPLVRSLAARTLREQGYTVLEAEHGAAALELLRRHFGPVHAVVSDVAMPVMSGRELAERLPESHRGVPVLLISGHTEDELVQRGLFDGRQVLLPKPFMPEQLVAAVQALVMRSARDTARASS